jgi:exoribonuclease-2
MTECAGQVIEYLDSGELRLGFVFGENKSRLQVRDSNGRQRNVTLRQVFITHTQSPEANGFSVTADKIVRQSSAICSEVDTELLWESLEDESGDYSIETLTELYFGQANPIHQSGVLRALLKDSARFKLRGTQITPRSPAQVREQLLTEKRKKEKELFRQEATTWLMSILDKGVVEQNHTTQQEAILRRLGRFLQNESDDEVRRWIAPLNKNTSPKVTVFEILSVAGRVPKEMNPLLVTFGVNPQFTKGAQDESAKLSPYRHDPKRSQLGETLVFSIDDEDTREIDDALSLLVEPDACTVGIHISDVSSFVEKDTLLDREAHRRRSTIYLPFQVIRMFPDRLSCDLASLKDLEPRPALSVLAEFKGNKLSDFRLTSSEVKVDRRLTYDEADHLLQQDGEDELTAQLCLLNKLAEGLMEERKAQGALVLRRPELKITAAQDEISVKVLEPDSPSRFIVSEMMILANQLVAQVAADNSIPMIYRSQGPPKEDVVPPEEYDPVVLNRIFPKLEKGKLTMIPQPHSGLGLKVYTQASSPIRRFLDLVGQRQIAAHVRGESAPYSANELIEILGSAQEVEGGIRSIERKVNRIYLLRFLSRIQRSEGFDSIVVKNLPDGGCLVETTDLFVRGYLPGSVGAAIGDRLELKIERIDPENDVLIFKPV